MYIVQYCSWLGGSSTVFPSGTLPSYIRIGLPSNTEGDLPSPPARLDLPSEIKNYIALKKKNFVKKLNLNSISLQTFFVFEILFLSLPNLSLKVKTLGMLVNCIK